MRWLFHDPNDLQEAAQRRDLVQRMDAWWAEFVRRLDDICASLKDKGRLDLPTWMHAHLLAVDDRLCWEYGPAAQGEGYRLVITPEADHELRPVVNTLLERAPHLAGWEFYPYRLAESVEVAHLTVEARVKLKIPDARVSVARGADHRVDVTFRSSAFAGVPEEQADHAAFVATETLLGEEALDRWVGVVEAERQGHDERRATRGERRFLPLERLKSTFKSVVAATLDQLPPRPLHDLDLTGSYPWSGYKREAPEQSEYADREDVFIGNTALVDVMHASARPGFFSGRFSRFGETFAYLKIGRANVPQKQWVEFRSRFEDAIEPALRAARAGCIYGAATGVTYSYIDLALTNVPRGVELMREVLRPLSVPRNSWLLFFDPEYADEWVGMWDDSPSPPARLERES